MTATLTERQGTIVSFLRVNDARTNATAFDHLENGDLVAAEINTLCEPINAEFMMEGILSTFEPNGYGLELEELLDVINRPRLNNSADRSR